MKFKNLLNKISKLNESGEHTNGGGLYIGDPQGSLGHSALTDKGSFNLQLPRQIDAINAMLYGLSCRDYIDPDGVIGVVKQKLNHFGLDFLAPNQRIPDGVSMYDLVQYGSPHLGVFGQNPYEDINKTGFNQGDGIKEKLGHSLSLRVEVIKQPNQLRKVGLVIVPTEESAIQAGSENGCGCEH